MPIGIHWGRVAGRADISGLIVSLDTLLGMSSNRFFPPLISKIEDGISSTARSPEVPG